MDSWIFLFICQQLCSSNTPVNPIMTPTAPLQMLVDDDRSRTTNNKYRRYLVMLICAYSYSATKQRDYLIICSFSWGILNTTTYETSNARQTCEIQ